MKPIISVIIPCYNTAKYIDKCLDSVLNNTFKNIEVIAIDDGSTDSTYKKLLKYAEKDSRMVVSTKKNTGQANTRNVAIKQARGEFIFFLDSDDYIDNDYLEVLYAKAKKGYDIVSSDIKEVDEEGNVINIATKIKYSKNDAVNYILNNFGPCCKLIRRKIITDNNLYFFEDHIYEDIAIVPAWGLYAKKFSYVPNKYYYYVHRTNSTMNQNIYTPKFEDLFHSLENLKKAFNNNYNKELEFIFIHHLLHGASLRFFKFKKYDMLNKINKCMKEDYPNWNKNEYYKTQGIKYKVVCHLFYKKRYFLLKLILKNR